MKEDQIEERQGALLALLLPILWRAQDRRGDDQHLGEKHDVPFGAEKCITFPSSLNILTSSIAWIGWTFSFLREVCSFLSSVPEVLCTFFTFRRGVPLPLEGRA